MISSLKYVLFLEMQILIYMYVSLDPYVLCILYINKRSIKVKNK